jgi:hypothetical protein
MRASRRFVVLGLRWLDTALDFPIDALSSHPKLRPARALQDSLMAPKRLGQLRNSTPNPPRLRVRLLPLFLPFLRVFASSREIADPSFLDCGGLTPLWISPSTRSLPIQSSVQPDHSKTPSWPQNGLGNCRTLPPTLRVSASPRETLLRPIKNIRIMGLTPMTPTTWTSSRLRVRLRILLSWTAVA